ncbi:unnamed protein product [Porites evermanni]|uniref:Uncharacterized protein n=1 Tax=Porites evermanni TaxID=104178 RepID=A0ABN8LZV8_9CNID|nr:unnamed protein product [Porites evermanni]
MAPICIKRDLSHDGKKTSLATSRTLLKELDAVLQDIIIKNKFYSTSRGDLADFSFPKILPTEVQTLHYKLPQYVTDVSAVSSIPSRSVFEVMIDTLRGGKYKAVSCSLGTYTISSLDTLLNVHSLRDIS